MYMKKINNKNKKKVNSAAHVEKQNQYGTDQSIQFEM